MVKKQPPTKRGHLKVTFELARPEARSVQLAGDFNGWSERVPMERLADGRWRASLELDANHTYEYRYLVNDDQWLNEPNADGYTPNPFGSENCVLHT